MRWTVSLLWLIFPGTALADVSVSCGEQVAIVSPARSAVLVVDPASMRTRSLAVSFAHEEDPVDVAWAPGCERLALLTSRRLIVFDSTGGARQSHTLPQPVDRTDRDTTRWLRWSGSGDWLAVRRRHDAWMRVAADGTVEDFTLPASRRARDFRVDSDGGVLVIARMGRVWVLLRWRPGELDVALEGFRDLRFDGANALIGHRSGALVRMRTADLELEVLSIDGSLSERAPREGFVVARGDGDAVLFVDGRPVTTFADDPTRRLEPLLATDRRVLWFRGDVQRFELRDLRTHASRLLPALELSAEEQVVEAHLSATGSWALFVSVATSSRTESRGRYDSEEHLTTVRRIHRIQLPSLRSRVLDLDTRETVEPLSPPPRPPPPPPPH